jgi:hypothetical protein
METHHEDYVSENPRVSHIFLSIYCRVKLDSTLYIYIYGYGQNDPFMEHHGTIKLYHLFLLGSSNIRVISFSPVPVDMDNVAAGFNWPLGLAAWPACAPMNQPPAAALGPLGVVWRRIHRRSCCVQNHFRSVPETFWGKMPIHVLNILLLCINFNFMLHSFLIMFLSFSAAIYQTYRSSKAICSNRQVGIRPNARGFSDSVLFLLSFCYRFGGLCRLPCSGFMNMYMYKLVNCDS